MSEPLVPGPGQDPSIPVAQIRAAVALLGPGEMTPTAKRMLLSICDPHDVEPGECPCNFCDEGDYDGCVYPMSEQVPEAGREPEKYRGWAKCHHTPEDREREHEDHIYGDDLGLILWEINDLGGAPTCRADQWWGISTSGVIWGTAEGGDTDFDNELRFETYIQGDTCLDAATETLRVWAERYEQHTGKPYVFGFVAAHSHEPKGAS